MIRKATIFPRQSFVYFIESTESGYIKIGYTTDVDRRMSMLQTSTPCPLKLIVQIPGGPIEEAVLHKAFLPEHKMGEWFNGYGRLRAFVDWLITLPESDRIAAIRRPQDSELVSWHEKDIDPEKMIANMLAVLEEEYGEEFAKLLWARAVERRPKSAKEYPRSLAVLRKALAEELTHEKAHDVVLEVRARA